MAIDNSGLVYLFDSIFQIENLAGRPVCPGHIEVFVAGTDTKYITYQNFDGTRNPFKVPLNSDGRAVILVEAQFKYDVYIYDSFNNMICSRLNVSPAVGGDVSVSGLTEVYHDGSLSGDGTPYAPLAVVSAGKVYSGIEPIVVNNDEDKISAQTASFGVESPLYFVKDEASATVIGVDQSAMENFLTGKADTTALDEIRDNMMSATAIGGVDSIITGYNGSAFSAGSTYSGIAPITVDNENKTISVSSKELEAQAPLQITDVGSAYQISLTGTLDPGALIVDYGAGTYAEIQSAVSEGRPVMAHRNAGGRDYYASLEQGAYGTYYFNCDDGDTQYTFTVNTTDTWATSSTNSLTGVSHDGTLLGSGTQSDPLGISYPLNPSDNEATASFNQYGVSVQDSEGREGHYGTTGITLTSGTASEVVNIQSIRNWESTYDTVAVNSASWVIEPSASKAIDAVTANSGDWNNVSAKLDTTAFSTVSGDFLTAHQALPESANWNSTYNIVYAKSGSWSSRPQEPVSGINIDIFESAGTVVFSGMTGGGSTYTGDAQGALDQVYTKSGVWATVTTKLDATAQVVTATGTATVMAGWLPQTVISSINGKAILPYGYSTLSGNSANWTNTRATVSANSANWNSTYDTVSTNSGNWTGGTTYTGDAQGALDEVYTNSGNWNSAAAMNELPVSAGQGMDIQNVDGNIVFSCTGGSVPEGVLVESGLEYNAVNEISGYSGSAFAQYGAEKQWLQHDDTLLHVANSAQYALGVNVSAVAQLMGVDETVLYSGTATNTGSLNESVENFDTIKVNYMTDDGMQGVTEFMPSYTKAISLNSMYVAQNSAIWFKSTNYTFSANTSFSSYPYQLFKANNGITAAWSNNTSNTNFRITRVIGIGRKA